MFVVVCVRACGCVILCVRVCVCVSVSVAFWLSVQHPPAAVAMQWKFQVCDRNAPYNQNIQSYVPGGPEECPCHGGGTEIWKRSLTPLSWKTAKSLWEFNSFLSSIQQVGINMGVGDEMYRIIGTLDKARKNPNTQEYCQHLYLDLHKVKNPEYQFAFYCNGCRSRTQYFQINQPEATWEAEACARVLDVIMAPYYEYFDGHKTGAFSKVPAPQPSLPHILPDDWPDCFHDTRDNCVLLTRVQMAAEAAFLSTPQNAPAPSPPPPPTLVLRGSPPSPPPPPTLVAMPQNAPARVKAAPMLQPTVNPATAPATLVLRGSPSPTAPSPTLVLPTAPSPTLVLPTAPSPTLVLRGSPAMAPSPTLVLRRPPTASPLSSGSSVITMTPGSPNNGTSTSSYYDTHRSRSMASSSPTSVSTTPLADFSTSPFNCCD